MRPHPEEILQNKHPVIKVNGLGMGNGRRGATFRN